MTKKALFDIGVFAFCFLLAFGVAIGFYMWQSDQPKQKVIIEIRTEEGLKLEKAPSIQKRLFEPDGDPDLI